MWIRPCCMHDTMVFIKNLRIHAHHGVMEQERCVGAEFHVTLQVKADIRKAFLSDNVEDTINYALMHQIVKKEMGIPSALLEHVAARIADAILQKFDLADEVMVEITKINPPIGAQCDGAGVRACFHRNQQ